jgi:hypothetical protein
LLKLSFSCYLPVAWLKIPGPHPHREVAPPTTAASAFARSRQIATRIAASAAAGGGDGGAAVVPMACPTQTVSTAETAGCLTGAMKRNAPRSARMGPVQAEAQTAGPVVAESRMTVRRRPAPSLPLTCASATFLDLVLSSLLVPGHHRAGMIPDHSAAESVLACGRAAGWTAQCCVRRVASGADVSRLAVALAAGVLALFVSAAIPLLRENEPVSPGPRAS